VVKEKSIGQEKQKFMGTKDMRILERYLTVWVGLYIVAGIALGKIAPGLGKTLNMLPSCAQCMLAPVSVGCKVKCRI